jgi:hypothetical protein
MKIEVKKEEVSTGIKFPLLMQTREGNIILVDGYSKDKQWFKGLALKHPEGVHYYNKWILSLQPFNGTITLSNE